MEMLIFLSCGFAITNAVVFLHAFHWWRKLSSGLADSEFEFLAAQGHLRGWRAQYIGRLVRCHACTGFWVGAFLSLICGGFIIDYVDIPDISGVIGDGLVLSGFNFVLWVVLRKLGVEDL